MVHFTHKQLALAFILCALLVTASNVYAEDAGTVPPPPRQMGGESGGNMPPPPNGQMMPPPGQGPMPQGAQGQPFDNNRQMQPPFEGGPDGFRSNPGGSFFDQERSGDNFNPMGRPGNNQPEMPFLDGRPGMPRPGTPTGELPSFQGNKDADFGKLLNRALGKPDQMRAPKEADGALERREGIPMPLKEWGNSGERTGPSGSRENFWEEKESSMGDQRLEETKRRLGGMQQGVKMAKKQLDRLAKKKIAVPTEISSLITELEKAVLLVKDATEENTEVEAAMDLIFDKGEDLRDIGPVLGVLEQWPRMEAQVTKRLASLKKEYEKTKAAALKAKLDISSGTSDVDALFAQIEAAFAATKADFARGELEGLMEGLSDEVFSSMGDLQDAVYVLKQSLQAGKNGKRALAASKKMITQFESQAKKLESSKKDVSELRILIANMQTNYKEAESLLGSGKLTAENMYDLFRTNEQLVNDIQDEVALLKGEKNQAEKDLELAAPTSGAMLIYSNILNFLGL